MLLKPEGMAPEIKTVALKPQEALLLAGLDDFLRSAGLGLFCVKCNRIFGAGHDGVVANNDPAGKYVKLDCGCTHRICHIGGKA